MSNLDELREKLGNVIVGEPNACWWVEQMMPFISQYTQQETLKSRMGAFETAIADLGYSGNYEGANQLRGYVKQLEAQLTTNKSKEK